MDVSMLNCPLCGSNIEEDEDLDVSDFVFCTNEECPGNDVGFNVEIDARGIKYLSENI
jgi:hypothetical protein